MKRLLAICVSLPLVLGAMVVGAQQTRSKASQEVTTKRALSHHAKISARKGAKRAAYRPEYKENSVEVINGDASKKVVFQDEQQRASAKNAPKSMKDVPPPLKVDVMNGSSTDTQYFYGNGQNEQIAAVRNRPVVIGVESSNTRMAGGNRHPVVTSVNSAENEQTKDVNSGGQPVTNSVSPRPKRPEYQPDVH